MSITIIMDFTMRLYILFTTNVSVKYRHRTMEAMESSVLRNSTLRSTGFVSGVPGGTSMDVDGPAWGEEAAASL